MAAVAVALLVALGKGLPILFSTLRIAISEYAAFRAWLRHREDDEERALFEQQ